MTSIVHKLGTYCLDNPRSLWALLFFALTVIMIGQSACQSLFVHASQAKLGERVGPFFADVISCSCPTRCLHKVKVVGHVLGRICFFGFWLPSWTR